MGDLPNLYRSQWLADTTGYDVAAPAGACGRQFYRRRPGGPIRKPEHHADGKCDRHHNPASGKRGGLRPGLSGSPPYHHHGSREAPVCTPGWITSPLPDTGTARAGASLSAWFAAGHRLSSPRWGYSLSIRKPVKWCCLRFIPVSRLKWCKNKPAGRFAFQLNCRGRRRRLCRNFPPCAGFDPDGYWTGK